MSEVERLAALERLKALREQERKEEEGEEESRRRVDEAVARRVEEELESRRDWIEEEVARRVAAAKAEMEAAMMAEVEKSRGEYLAEETRKEVGRDFL